MHNFEPYVPEDTRFYKEEAKFVNETFGALQESSGGQLDSKNRSEEAIRDIEILTNFLDAPGNNEANVADVKRQFQIIEMRQNVFNVKKEHATFERASLSFKGFSRLGDNVATTAIEIVLDRIRKRAETRSRYISEAFNNIENHKTLSNRSAERFEPLVSSLVNIFDGVDFDSTSWQVREFVKDLNLDGGDYDDYERAINVVMVDIQRRNHFHERLNLPQKQITALLSGASSEELEQIQEICMHGVNKRRVQEEETRQTGKTSQHMSLNGKSIKMFNGPPLKERSVGRHNGPYLALESLLDLEE